MLSINRKKELISLKQKKYRQKYGQFLVEGEKSVSEFCHSEYKIDRIYMTKQLKELSSFEYPDNLIEIIDEREMKQISVLETAPGIIAVVKIKEHPMDLWKPEGKISIMLESISDPGNLGTIIRIADWYGIKDIVCSEDCVDVYNPKVISSSMGSVCRVDLYHSDLINSLSNRKINVYACVMKGESLQNHSNILEGIVLIGNESKGLSNEILPLATHRITIPRVGSAESLNAAIATAIVCHKMVLG
ncbi:MAG: RNA methyltransferase [Flavobacteriales bacterium]|nr:RNA methyltransferase [Flavobacteriales bacterium]